MGACGSHVAYCAFPWCHKARLEQHSWLRGYMEVGGPRLGPVSATVAFIYTCFLCSPLRPSRRHFPRVMPLSKPGRG